MEYRTVIAPNNVELDRYVNTFIAEGWRPLGGVSVSVTSEDPSLTAEHLYVQAMTKEPEHIRFVDGSAQEAV